VLQFAMSRRPGTGEGEGEVDMARTNTARRNRGGRAVR